ncbi:chitin-binding domain protein cbd-1-like [Channa argus]|uniref:chitin-binding domain protein cbd-1-like n=1 Tax=Channa argus TaxID=215402 RepID=UPI00352154FF
MCRLILTAGLYLIVAILASGGDSQQFCIGKTDGDYANPNDVNSFYSCSNGVVYIKYCQPGLIFNESCDCCDWPPTAAPTATDQLVNTTKSAEPSQNVCNGKSDGDYANPNNLNSFYSCSNGVVYIKYCQPGLIFNESCDCCDWPPTAAPTATDQSVNTTKSPEPSQNVCNGKSDGDYANPNDLNSFYSCSNGVVYIKYCQPGLIFNESCDCCDWPPTAAPTATDQFVNTTKSAEPSQNVCNGKSDGDYANPNDLNSFYSCSNGVVYIKYCQPGLIFNESCDCCDWPPTAAPTATDQSVNTTKSPEPSQNVCNGKSDGDYANPNDLNSFYSCSNGVVYIKYCQPGLIFNESCDCCDWPPTAAPTATDQSVNTTKSPEPSQNVCNGKSDGDYANPNDLNSFYSCSNGVVYIKYCQPGLIFNESCDCCDWPPTAAPTATDQSVNTTKSPEPSQNVCNGKSDGDYANPNDLNSFYSCSNGVVYIKYCQPGLIFNESCDCCDWPPTAAPTATDQLVNTTKSAEPSQNVCNGKSDGDYANPNDLNSFYSCSNGVVYIKYCQPGLIFNESCDCCDWPPTAAPTATDQSVNITKSPEPSQNVCNGKSDGDYANPNDLNSFYSCSNGVVYIKYCQPGLIFNESCNCCDSPTTEAPTTTTQRVTKTKSPAPCQHFCSGKRNGYYANPNNLNSFYSCSNGVVCIKYCQPGLIFKESCDCCDWPTTAAPTTTTQRVTKTKSPAPCQHFCSGKRDGYYANPNNLNSFYSCSNGVVCIKYCQPGLIFNESCNCCDWPTTAAPTTTTPRVTTAKSPAPCQHFCSGKRDGYYANPNNLNSFYSCSNGVVCIKYCQPGLIFNESCNSCDWPTTAAPTTTTQRVTKTKSPAPCQHFCSGKRNGNYANPKNPYLYFRCSKGRTYIGNCQPGFIFKESCNCCDWVTAPTTTINTDNRTTTAESKQDSNNTKNNGDYVKVNSVMFMVCHFFIFFFKSLY